ncbi:hypothetical protein ED733_007465 [Metarhizium rileyi]|uniref:Gfd2/YDR514C-like C-terminal domain-containing protein n=1 Tax=Metarhizium rileyi (strain RCEF 4871) TaxID=1649241 RepID=A0A5C6GIU3_METRR|nr:hypothetical protein ED733_007465 [Metarhizium rileyi]
MASFPCKPKSGRHGGLGDLERLFRVSDQNTFPHPDIIFISIDLEVSREERARTMVKTDHIPHIKELGFAWMDSRQIFSAAPLQSRNKEAKTSSVSTRQFSTSSASKDFEDCDVTNFQECIFAETFRVAPEDIPATVIRCLQFRDELSVEPNALRNVAIVGHSPGCDIKLIQRLGVDICSTCPVIAVLDTYLLSRYILGNTSTKPSPTKFSLGAILQEMQCPHNYWELHNAGNDATYTLHVLVSLVLRWAERKEPTADTLFNVDCLKAFLNFELHESPRWEPVRCALGAHWSKDENAEQD